MLLSRKHLEQFLRHHYILAGIHAHAILCDINDDIHPCVNDNEEASRNHLRRASVATRREHAEGGRSRTKMRKPPTRQRTDTPRTARGVSGRKCERVRACVRLSPRSHSLFHSLAHILLDVSFLQMFVGLNPKQTLAWTISLHLFLPPPPLQPILFCHVSLLVFSTTKSVNMTDKDVSRSIEGEGQEKRSSFPLTLSLSPWHAVLKQKVYLRFVQQR